MSKTIVYNDLEEIKKIYPKYTSSSKKVLEEGYKKNELEVIYLTTPNASRSLRYVCKCSCGKYCIISSTNLIKEVAKSCGHLRGSQKEDLANQRFGKLIALNAIKKNNRIYWECQCDCGGFTVVKASHLKEGKIQSCGCLKSIGEEKISKILQENKIKFIKQYNDLKCIFPDSKRPAIFDFYIPYNNSYYLIEYDGIQHFSAKSENTGWNTELNLLKTKKRDKYKNQWCKENNIPLIRIPYTHLKDLCLKDLQLETSKFIINKEVYNESFLYMS